MPTKKSILLTVSGVLPFLSLLIILTDCSSKKQPEPGAEEPVPQAELAPIPDSVLIAAGKELFYSPGLGSANKSCASCHIEGMDLKGVASSFPKFSDMAGREVSLTEVNNICIERALKGRPLDPESTGAQALAAYIRSLE